MWRSVRKFGLEYCDLATMISNVSAMLRVLTLNIDARNKKRIPIFCYIITVISSVLYIYVYVISGFWFSFWRCQETGDLVAAMIVFSLNTTSEVAVIKLYYMKYLEKQLKNLTQKYFECDSRILKGSRFSVNMVKALRNVKKRAIIFWMVLMVDCVLYVAKPIVTPGQHLTVDAYVIYGLEPMFQSPNYEIATIVMSIDVFFICYIVANIAAYLIVIVGYTEAQMLSLSDEMIHLCEDAQKYYQETINEFNCLESIYSTRKFSKHKLSETYIINEFVKKNLADIIRRHAVNVDLLKEIEHVMRGPNAIGFLFLIIGLIAELLGGLENTFLQLPFTLIQVAVDCYLGQKIMDANKEFERAIYDCGWENFNQSNKKIVLVMLQNSQKTMTLSAGGMAILNFSCFMSIIRSAYSAYTTLRSII